MRLSLLILPIITLSSCITNNQDKIVENRIYDCLVASYSEQGVNLEEEIDSFQNYLITEEYLKDASGKAILGLYERMAATNEFPVSRRDKWEGLEKVNFVQFADCFGKEQDTVIGHTKLDLLGKKLRETKIPIDSGIAKTGSIMISIFDAEDFEREPMRTYALWTFYFAALQDAGLDAVLQEVPVDNTVYNYLIIRVTEDDEIRVDGEKIDIGDIKSLARKHYDENVGNAGFLIEIEKGTAFDTYVNISDRLYEVKSEYWEEQSGLMFGRPFSQLNEEEKAAVREKVKFKIRG